MLGDTVPTPVLPQTPEGQEIKQDPTLNPYTAEGNPNQGKPREETYAWFDGDSGVLKLAKLEQAFRMGCNVKEACLFAEISYEQYNYYCKNVDEDYQKKVELWRETPVLIARKSVIKDLPNDSKLAFDYLRHKRPDEFKLKSETEVGGKDGAPIEIMDMNEDQLNAKVKDLLAKLKKVEEFKG
jgi:hypothetical protein